VQRLLAKRHLEAEMRLEVPVQKPPAEPVHVHLVEAGDTYVCVGLSCRRSLVE
jgi:hypothetical protein